MPKENKPLYQDVSKDGASYLDDMLEQPHLLISGTTGAGKTFLAKKLLDKIISRGYEPVVIDSKQFEFIDYKKKLPRQHRATDTREIEMLLHGTYCAMLKRFKYREKHPDVKFNPIYVLIDEYWDVKNYVCKQVQNELSLIASKGRAGDVHLIVCTQRATRDVIDKMIKANFTGKVALRCLDGQESKNVIGIKGAENLERYGYALYQSINHPQIIKIKV